MSAGRAGRPQGLAIARAGGAVRAGTWPRSQMRAQLGCKHVTWATLSDIPGSSSAKPRECSKALHSGARGGWDPPGDQD